MPSQVYLYADESCLGIQFTDRDSPGGAAGLLEYWTRNGWVRRDYWLSEPASTNNRMALRGAIVGLDLLRRRCHVLFTSDSQYLVLGMREWVHGWIRRGWKRKGGEIENLELWQDLVRASARHSVDWQWVRGHAGHPQNEYANDLAVAAAREQIDSGGFVDSRFTAWLADQRERRKRYLTFDENSGPGS